MGTGHRTHCAQSNKEIEEEAKGKDKVESMATWGEKEEIQEKNTDLESTEQDHRRLRRTNKLSKVSMKWHDPHCRAG